MSLALISFSDSDYPSPSLEPAAEEIATFLYENTTMMKYFTELMRTAGNKKLNQYNQHLQRYFSVVLPKSKAADRKYFEKLMYKFLKVCSNDKELAKMRGLVPEKYFEIIFEKRHTGKKCVIGYGKKVVLDGTGIVYVPETPFENKDDSDQRRQTVDAGYWDGEQGEFVEIKLNPEAFRTKDINYLKLLSGKLDEYYLDYLVYLVALGNKDLIIKRLIRLKLWSSVESTYNFKLVGIEELKVFGDAC